MKFILFCFPKLLTEQNKLEANEFNDKQYLSAESPEQGNVLLCSKTKRFVLFAYVLKKIIASETDCNYALFLW